MQRIASVSFWPQAAGLIRGFSPCAMRWRVSQLVTQARDAAAESSLLAGCAAGQAMVAAGRGGTARCAGGLDITGCAHLFGGEPAMVDQIAQRLERIGPVGAGGAGRLRPVPQGYAHAYAGAPPHSGRRATPSSREARATRSRAAKRPWTGPLHQGGIRFCPRHCTGCQDPFRHRPSACGRAALDADTVAASLTRLWPAHIAILTGSARGAGAALCKGLCSALDSGRLAAQRRTISSRAPTRLATRMRPSRNPWAETDMLAAWTGLPRLLPNMLRDKTGAAFATLRLEAYRSDGTTASRSPWTPRPRHP